MKVTIDDVWRTEAGARLFNAVTAMQLNDQQGYRVYFSRRVEITKRFIGMLLEGGLVPEDMTPKMAPVNSRNGEWE